jgi:hypothetical protein
MRYACGATASKAALTRGVACASLVAATVVPRGLRELLPALRLAARVAAVDLTPIATAADDEQVLAVFARFQAVRAVDVSRDGVLPRRGAGRASFNRGDSRRIPAAIHGRATWGRLCQQRTPVAGWTAQLGSFYSQLRRVPTGAPVGQRRRVPTRTHRGEPEPSGRIDRGRNQTAGDPPAAPR